jgi:signal transduction histidine kinase
MSSPKPRWWIRRSLRLRVTVFATAVLGIGLIAGVAGLAALFVHTRVAAVDVVVRAEMDTVSQLTATGDLPSPLPVPAAGTALAQVIDAAGTVLAATASASRVVAIIATPLSSAKSDRIFTTTSSALGSSTLRIETRTAIYRGVPITIIAAVPFADVSSTLAALQHVLIVAVPIILLAAAAATWLAVGSALRPVDELRAAADAIDIHTGATAPQLAIPVGADELRRLAETLNRMLQRLHHASEQQRGFIADAAHELRSPIASVQTQLEIALSMPTATNDWPAIADDILTDVQRLSALAADLLLLARLEAGSETPDAIVDIGALAEPDGPAYLVHGDESSLRRLLDNLINNAKRHADHRVEVHATTDAGDVVITIDDDGPGIASADRERVFARWVRLDVARSRNDGGSGLGLPIARSIARAHDGDVVLRDSPLGGVRAVLRLPQADRPTRR